MVDFLARRVFARLAARTFDALSPTGKQRREEEERVATMFGFGGMTERERYREAVRREVEREAFQRAQQAEADRLETVPGFGGMSERERWQEAGRWLEAEKKKTAEPPRPDR